jgi:hypothetical protein
MQPLDLQVGKHVVRSEGDDVVFIRIVGLQTAEETLELVTAFNGFLRARDHRNVLWILTDMTEMTGLPAESRRLWGTASKQGVAQERVAMVCIGASFMVRTLAMLVIKAADLVGGLDTPVHFVKTEAEARALLPAAEGAKGNAHAAASVEATRA